MDHKRNDATEPFARLADAVDALTEVNYPGGEFETLIDELGTAFSDYRAHRRPHSSR